MLKKFPNTYDDIIFMDIQMPIMDGITATRLLRTEHHCTSPIIAMTADLLECERQVYLNSGMDDLVPKPVDYKALYQSLVQYANKHKQSPTSGTSQNIEPSNDLDPTLSK